jgi:hypothetical protein
MIACSDLKLQIRSVEPESQLLAERPFFCSLFPVPYLRNKFRSKKSRFAGRSAKRRMK